MTAASSAVEANGGRISHFLGDGLMAAFGLGCGPKQACLQSLLALVALGFAVWRLVGRTPYRIDVDVYRMGGQAWLDGHPLYSHDAKFHTPIGLNLPFTYPPLAAIVFCPFAWLGMPAASVAITLITLALLLVSTLIVLTRLDVWNTTHVVPGPAWLRRWWLTALIVAAAIDTIAELRTALEVLDASLK